jgi:hypothetical protein
LELGRGTGKEEAATVPQQVRVKLYFEDKAFGCQQDKMNMSERKKLGECGQRLNCPFSSRIRKYSTHVNP